MFDFDSDQLATLLDFVFKLPQLLRTVRQCVVEARKIAKSLKKSV